MQAKPDRPDWRDSRAYAPLLEADRALVAWEWLRRDPLYASAAAEAGRTPNRCGTQRTQRSARRFGLVRFEPCERRVPDARPLWTGSACPQVLEVVGALGGGAEDAFDDARFAEMVTIGRDPHGEHLLLSDGLRMLRID